MLRSVLFLSLSVLVTAAPAMAGEDPSERPEAFTLGLGGGMSLPQSGGGRGGGGLTLDTASARLRLTDGFTLEPLVTYSQLKDEYKRTGDNKSSDRDKQTTTELALGTRTRLGAREAVDCLLLVGLSYSKRLSENNLDEDARDQYTQTTKNVSLDWGLGLEGFINRHWSVGVDASNPLVTIRNEQQENDGDTSSSNRQTLSLSFAPTLRVQSHIYF